MTARPPRRHIEALRALQANPGGLRIGAHPSSMRALKEVGYVEARAPQGRPNETRWFLTQSGRDLLRALGAEEAE